MQFNCVYSKDLLRLEIYAVPLGNTPPRQNFDTSALALCQRQFPFHDLGVGDLHFAPASFSFAVVLREGFSWSVATMW